MNIFDNQKRRASRERVMQALYAYEISRDSVAHIIDTILKENLENGTDIQFATSLLVTTIEHLSDLDAVIKKKTDHWELGRIALVDKLILRMGTCELLYFEEIPPKVTINEAIEIAKKFSTEKSGQFVNGILDTIHLELKETGALHKTGRGLVTSSTPKPQRKEK